MTHYLYQHYDDQGRVTCDGVPDLPGVVVAALFRAYPDLSLSHVFWNSVMSCWTFEKNGMMIGVERDGYVHT